MAEDAASVLEQFCQDVANLPAEIAHLLEEIQAKDRSVAEYRSLINARDTSIQKHLKAQNFSCAIPHPKDDVYCKAVTAAFDKAQAAQDEKVTLSEKAALLLDRQIKRLDFKIRDLQNEGSIQPDPQLPSLLTNATTSTRLPTLSSASTPTTGTPLNPIPGNAGPSTTIANNPLTRLVQPTTGSNRHSSPLPTSATAPAAGHQVAAVRSQQARSPSVDNTKRRRLNPHHPNMPVTSSSLRQSSLGPGTPKGGIGLDGASRGSSAGPSARTSKKNGPRSGLTAPHNRVNALSTTDGNAMSNDPTNPAGASNITKSRPSNHKRRGGGNHKPKSATGDGISGADDDDDDEEEDEDEDEIMDDAPQEEAEAGEEGEEAAEGEGDDMRKYCTCHTESYGNMVACDNDGCPYEWFHWSCVGVRSEPAGKWFCPECRRGTAEGRKWVAGGMK